MIKFCVLGSGSKGNSVYFNVDGKHLLVDAGFSKKEINRRLATIGKSMDDIEFIFITHAHKDHYAAWLQKDTTRKVYTKIRPQEFSFIKSFPLSHDSEHGSIGYVVKDEAGNKIEPGNKIAVILDTGCIPEEILPNLFDCAAVLIETNYDIDMLIDSPYPTDLQLRISSDVGHLRAECAAEAVGMVAWPGLQYVCALHLSSNCINPVLARFELDKELRDVVPGCEIVISDQKIPTKLFVVM